MLAGFIITFREALEISLIIGIIISYLSRIKQFSLYKVVLLGTAFGIVTSALLGLFIFVITGELSGQAEAVFEAVIMLIGAVLLTSMIIWMHSNKNASAEIKAKLKQEIKTSHRRGLFALTSLLILREGVEIVIFLTAVAFNEQNPEYILVSSFFGFILAMLLGYLVFVTTVKIDLKFYFSVTGIILMFFAAGLFAHAIHEFQEAGIIGYMIEHVWDTSRIISDSSFTGSILKSLFGYNDNPSLLEVLIYLGYLGGSMFYYFRNSGDEATNKTA